MTTKLTLRLEEELIRRAKQAARVRGISVSRMVSDYFRTIPAISRKGLQGSPVLLEVSGILSGKDDKEVPLKHYKKHLEEKYL